MSIRQTLFGIVVLATSSVGFTQAAGTKPSDSGSVASGSQMSVSPTPCQSGGMTLAPPEILTDTQGADFGPYMITVVKTVRQNWNKLMPPSAYPPVNRSGKLSIEFSILKDGRVSGMVLHKVPEAAGLNIASGDATLDLAAWGSITASTPFPPLPKAFSGEELRLAFYFYYNSPPEMSQFSISPCSDVQATNGSTLQFAASGNGITASSVSWGISGTGCTKSACGTISNSGLYTAPANVPSPPTVIVEATSRTDTNITAKSKITIVSANSPH